MKHAASNRHEGANPVQPLIGLIASELTRTFPLARVTPGPGPPAPAYRIGGDVGAKRADVAVWDDRLGLVLGMSCKNLTAAYAKTASRADAVQGCGTKLGFASAERHRRQPYAYLVATVFMPLDSTWDMSSGREHSWFAEAVFSLRGRSGRTSPRDDRFDLLERAFVGLLDGGTLIGFFDVQDRPRRNQPPARMLSLEDMVADSAAAARSRHVGDGEVHYVEDDHCWHAPDGPAG